MDDETTYKHEKLETQLKKKTQHHITQHIKTNM